MIDTGVFMNIIDNVKSAVENASFDSGIRLGVVVYHQSTVFYKLRSL
jgi:hypothetical protein